MNRMTFFASPAFGCREGLPSYARLGGAGHRLDRVPAGGRETRAADPVGGLREAILIGDDLGRLAERLSCVLAVNR
jgi:hypothetical protein